MTDATTPAATQDYAAEWWAALGRGELTVQHCRACGESQLYPRRRCVSCSSDRVEYVPVTGQGKVYTFSTIYKNPPSEFVGQGPYTLAVVVLDEGPRMLTRIERCAPEDVRCDMPVRLAVTEINGRGLPTFAPV